MSRPRLDEQVRLELTGPEGNLPFPGLVVAVSGGPDSVALTRAALAARGPRPVPVVLAHLNHQLRGAESDQDEAFVVDWHASLVGQGVQNLFLAHTRLDIAALAREHGKNVEAAARRLRYRWLAEVARSHGLSLVATGHTATDQAETILHHILRGTGLAGLRGIARRRELEPGVEVIRPLLAVSRADILAYLEELGQSWRQDSSNTDLRFTRNRLRHELLPHLRQHYNPRLDEVLARLAEQADEVCRHEDEEAAALLRQAELPRAGERVVLDVHRLREVRGRLVRLALRQVWAREGWPMGELGQVHWQRLEHLIRADQGALDVPGGIHARRRGHILLLGPKKSVERR